MSLTRNGSHQYSGLNKIFGVVGAYGLYSNFDHNGANNAFNSGSHTVSSVTNKASRPAGARPPVAWRMAMKAGSLASHNEAHGEATASLAMVSGRNVSGTTAGSSTASATAKLVVSTAGTSAGTSTANASINAALQMSGTSAGSSTASATIGANAFASGTSSGSSTVTGTIYALGHLAGSISPFTELSPQGLAQYVIEYATATPIAANIAKVNGYTVQGNGQTGSEWGPV